MAMVAAGRRLYIDIPKTYKQAITDPIHGEELINAIFDEVTYLEAYRAWREEPILAGVN